MVQLRTALIRMRSDSPPFDDVKKEERHLRDFWGYYVFLYFGLCFHVFGVVFGHVYFGACCLWTCVFEVGMNLSFV